MTLFIDTTDFNKVTFALAADPLKKKGVRKVLKKSYKIDPHQSHKTLAKLDEFLRKSKIRSPESEIKNIIVNSGPGSYTGVRIGLVIAQALGFAWQIPIHPLPKDKFKIH